MKTIYLYDHYPNPCGDAMPVEVTDEVFSLLQAFIREKRAQEKRIRRNLSNYTFIDGETEMYMFNKPMDFIDKIIMNDEIERLHRALLFLTETERRRIIKHFFEDFSYARIAEHDGVSRGTIQVSIKRTLRKLIKLMNI